MKIPLSLKIFLGVMGTTLLILAIPSMIELLTKMAEYSLSRGYSVYQSYKKTGGAQIFLALILPIIIFLPLGWGISETRLIIDKNIFQKLVLLSRVLLVVFGFAAGLIFILSNLNTIDLFTSKYAFFVTYLVCIGTSYTVAWGRIFNRS